MYEEELTDGFERMEIPRDPPLDPSVKTRPVRDILEEMINKLPGYERSRSCILDPKQYLMEVLSAVNSSACADAKQEEWIKDTIYSQDDDSAEQRKNMLLHILVLNSLRG